MNAHVYVEVLSLRALSPCLSLSSLMIALSDSHYCTTYVRMHTQRSYGTICTIWYRNGGGSRNSDDDDDDDDPDDGNAPLYTVQPDGRR